MTQKTKCSKRVRGVSLLLVLACGKGVECQQTQ